MHPDRDFDPEQPPPWNAEALAADLALDVVLQAMAGDEALLLKVSRAALLSATRNGVEVIRYRQEVLQDALNNGAVVEQMYALVHETFEKRRNYWWGITSRYPSSILYTATSLVEMLVGMLEQLRTVAEQHGALFRSRGFTSLFDTLRVELDREYLAHVRQHLGDLQFRHGMMVSAGLGDINQVTGHVLREPPRTGPTWLERLIGRHRDAFTFEIDPRDEAGARALGELKDRAINSVANALAQSADHMLGFFTALQTELAFYLACRNLHRQLASRGAPIAFPDCESAGAGARRFRDLRDPSLVLTLADRPVVGNTVDADRRSLVIVTGANQGGKSTFLRSIGLAQLMMQTGLFVTAEAFTAEVCPALFTHFKRAEDATMKSGKLDEELARMSDIADHVQPHALVLFNESFAATNAREGSEIARQIVEALVEANVRVIFVTHLYEFASQFAGDPRGDVLFLRAERGPDGSRAFSLATREPLETSYGEDVYREVFD